jgi:8-oxo-dGTP diphosphatase
MTTRAHVFIVHDGKILVLQQAGGRRWWEHPGGDVEDGETAQQAAIRETLEETGLRIRSLELLRDWSYVDTRGVAIDCYAYAAEAPTNIVQLSVEHTAYAWMTVEEYAQRYCSEKIESAVPQFASFLSGLRENCRLFSQWFAARDERFR